MWVYYEEIDGRIDPKWIILKANSDIENPYYWINQPFERFYPEDFHDDIRSLSIDIGELFRNPLGDSSFGIDLSLLQKRLLKDGYNPDWINDVEYFIMLCDDLQEIMNFNIKNLLRFEGGFKNGEY